MLLDKLAVIVVVVGNATMREEGTGQAALLSIIGGHRIMVAIFELLVISRLTDSEYFLEAALQA
jgi:hypothetical protein